MKIPFSKLKMKSKYEPEFIPIPDTDIKLEVKQYLPIQEKADFINFVVGGALDTTTGCFSPIRIEIYWSIALARFYGNITFTDRQMQDVAKIYDTLQSNDVFYIIENNIPDEELKNMRELTLDTCSDIARYNSSTAGMLALMSKDAEHLGEQIEDITQKVKNREGIEDLKVVTDILGKDRKTIN